MSSVWPLVASHLEDVITTGTPTVLIERAVAGVLRLLLRLTHVVYHTVK